MAIAQGKGTRIYKGAKLHSDMTTEAMTYSGGNNAFCITDKAKRYWDESHAFTVYSNGTPVSPANYSIQYPGGWVVFNSTTYNATTVTVSGGYFAIDKTYQVTGTESEYSYDEVDTTAVECAATRLYPVNPTPKGKLTINGLHEDTTWFDRGGGRYIIVDADSGVYAANSITSGTRWEYYARLSDEKGEGMNPKDVLRDTVTLESDGPVYYRSD